MAYIYEQKDWPEFRWSTVELSSLVANIRHKQGLLLGRMSVLGFQLRNEASLEILTTDVVKSSAIEGERERVGRPLRVRQPARGWHCTRLQPAGQTGCRSTGRRRNGDALG